MNLFFGGFLLFLFLILASEQRQENQNRNDDKRSFTHKDTPYKYNKDYFYNTKTTGNDIKYEGKKPKWDKSQKYSKAYNGKSKGEAKYYKKLNGRTLWPNFCNDKNVGFVSRNGRYTVEVPQYETVGEYGKVAKEITKVAPMLGFGYIFHDFFDIFYERNETKQREKVVKKSTEYIFSYIGGYAGAAIKTAILAGIGTLIGKCIGGIFGHSVRDYFMQHNTD